MSKNVVPIEVIQETAKNQRRARNLATMHAIAAAPKPQEEEPLDLDDLLAPAWSLPQAVALVEQELGGEVIDESSMEMECR